jgi:hypothetical protein
MNRRTYLRTCGIAAAGGLATLAGCSGNNQPPPRESSVIEEIDVNGDALVIDLESDSNQWIKTREELDAATSIGGTVSSLSPVGVASARKGATSRGSRSGYRNAPDSPTNGRAWWGGGDYVDDWYEDHRGEIDRVPVGVAAIGVAYLGTNDEFKENPPGPGKPDESWDKTYDDPSGTVKPDLASNGAGWYRIGAKVTPEAGGSLAKPWEAVDLRVDGNGNVEENWKVSPKI